MKKFVPLQYLLVFGILLMLGCVNPINFITRTCGGVAGAKCPDGYQCILPNSNISDDVGHCEPVSQQEAMCGGVAGIRCPDGYSCVIDSNPNISDNSGHCKPQVSDRMLSADSVINLNLKQNDVPHTYYLNASQGGYITDLLNYSEGNEMDAQRMSRNGWASITEVYYNTYKNDDKNGYPINNIYSGLSIYNKVDLMDCALKEADYQFAGPLNNGTFVSTSRVFGDGSILYYVNQSDPVVGTLYFYEMRFYYGNVFVNLELGGPKGAFSESDVEYYANVLEQRLKTTCPNCARAPLCPYDKAKIIQESRIN